MSSAKSRQVIMLPVQSRMARAGLELSIIEVAKAAKVSPATVVRFERGEELKPRTVEAIQRAYEAAGIEFVNGEGPGLRILDLRAKNKVAQAARR